ncbi:MAG: AMP phosphorylase [Candidatus Kerfeldbacteria bacterium]|nr:AMP phosphorylase [Candidatus Kerfeldbacteria bacterium]
MAFVLNIRRIDIDTGGDTQVVLLRGRDADAFGITPGDRLQIRYQQRTITAVADITHHSIRHGEIGVFTDLWRILKPTDGQTVTIDVLARPPSIAAIKKKLLGKEITASEIHSIISDIVSHRLSAIETTYFVASGYIKPYTTRELVGMVRAMAETGEMFTWRRRLVVDKHSVGGLAGNRTTMVAIPIIASLGLLIPKTSSRAITSPSGTADTMEVLAPVSFDGAAVRRIVRQAGGCLIWGGGLSIAPADDIIIRVSRPLSLEPYDKMIVSIMAKKVAMGVRYLIIDLPYGPGTKISSLVEGRKIEQRFRDVGRAFGISVRVKFDRANEPIGQGIGPALEARDVLRVLQQKDNRPRDLEEKALGLAGELLELSSFCTTGKGYAIATQALRSGRAWAKMQQIIKLQGGNPLVDADELLAGTLTADVKASATGRVSAINNRAIDEIARTLGAPDQKRAGIYLHKKLGDRVKRGQTLLTLYAVTADRLALARQALRLHTIITIGR